MSVSLEQIGIIYHQSLPDLIYQAQSVHRQTQEPQTVQLCTLCNIKAGGCPEDCGYCSQSLHRQHPMVPSGLLPLETVVQEARAAKAQGSSRFCMGAAWREVQDGHQFDQVLEMVRQVAALDLEVCCTLGMLTPAQAQRLKAAGLTAYNHNLDTSPTYYPQVVSTRTYQDRLATLKAVGAADISICCGCILGLGETIQDRWEFLQVLTTLTPAPESIPINCLVPIPGTPLAPSAPVDYLEVLRLVATTRILFPQARIRLSAGRLEMGEQLQLLCFLAGANSIFTGPALLTTPNPTQSQDQELLERFGLSASPVKGMIS